MPEAKWNQRRWVWAIWAGSPTLVVLPYKLINDDGQWFAESGVLESGQAGLWIVSIIAAMIVYTRLAESPSKWGTALLGALASIATLREFDVHIYLNPKAFGPWGVHFRIDWWLETSNPLAPKIIWASLCVGVIAAFCFLGYKSRQPIRWTQPRPRLLLACFLLVLVGFVFDDILRGGISLSLAQRIEESVEFIAAMCFLGAVLAPGQCETKAAPPEPVL